MQVSQMIVDDVRRVSKRAPAFDVPCRLAVDRGVGDSSIRGHDPEWFTIKFTGSQRPGECDLACGRHRKAASFACQRPSSVDLYIDSASLNFLCLQVDDRGLHTNN